MMPGEEVAKAPRVAKVTVGRPDDAGSCRAPDISMIEATRFGNLHHRTHLRPLDGPPVWRILVEREVSPCPVIVREVGCQDPAAMRLVKNEDLGPDTRAGRSRRAFPRAGLAWGPRLAQDGQGHPDRGSRSARRSRAATGG